MDLYRTYKKVGAVLAAIDFESLLAGFHRYKYAIYNSQEICYDGKVIPYEECFRGNTSLLYNGEYTAVWNIEMDPIEDMDILVYSLVHEMYHCHQQAHGEKRFPSDLRLLRYPEDTGNFIKKYNENLYLADAYERCDKDSLRKFAAVRSQRMKQYPNMVRQELMAETVEGMAEYAGLKALWQINRDKYAAVVRKSVNLLREKSERQFDVRKMAYYTGSMFILCLDLFGCAVRNDFGSMQTVYEQNPIADGGVEAEIVAYEFIERQYAAFLDKRQK